MRNLDERAAGSASAGAIEPHQLYVITAASSTAPVPLQVPKVPELAGLAVFRSRRVEDGRERFRLHIGYFPSAAAAELIVPFVRTIYPAAIVAPAPQANLGSLEDTAVARFSIIKPMEGAASEPVPAAVAPALQPAAAPPVLGAADVVVAAPVAARAPAPERAPAAAPAPPPVVALTPEPATDAKAAQHYAVQLIWSAQLIDLGKLPSLEIFGGYLLYAVETEPGGRQMYGVRLGFYDDALSAQLVAQTVRTEFRGVTVVPVSVREVARASSAAIRLLTTRGHGVTSSRVRWPQKAVAIRLAPSEQSPAAASS